VVVTFATAQRLSGCLVSIRGVHGNGSSHGNWIPMRFPPERELNLNKDGNGEHNNMEVGTVNDCRSQNHSRGFVKSHYATLCALCLRLSHKGP